VGWPGFPHSGKERAGKKGESGKAGVPSQWEGTGQEAKGESGKAGAPSQWEGTGQEERRKRESRGSLAMGGNGPGREEKAGKPGFPRNGRERARKKRETAGKPGFPRNGRERARKKGESGLSVRSEAESESVLELG
jgi:hypothetical protein